MIDRLRAFFAVVEDGSVNRAALRLRITQPALSRQMKSLEDEVGGRLLERESKGVTPTDLGHFLIREMEPVVSAYDASLAKVRRRAGGDHRAELRVGYLISAAQPVLTPALDRLRKTHPDLKLKLYDLSPREQIDGLRAGDLDVAITGQEGAVGARDFPSKKLCTLGVCAAFSIADAFGSRDSVALADLKSREFIGVDEDQMPGRNRWMSALCCTAGFKPRFVAITDGITNVLSLVASESAVTLLPDYFRHFSHPGVTMIPISDPSAHWDFIVLWQRGKMPATTRSLVEGLATALAKIGRF